MSADRWSTCPVCIKRAEERIELLERQKSKDVEVAFQELEYGEYVEFVETHLSKKIEKAKTALKKFESTPSVREDFNVSEIELEGDKMSVFFSYTGTCRECGHSVTAKIEERK